ncbi:Cmpk2 [Symbiodinium natans]|uniref:Cmpk2 protein n=1 Tax=Symbiodinium natans TaxID=878477 RepID=A0A812SMC8_9DINO|nr:Cmpk2 [Symbiodinium natans]
MARGTLLRRCFSATQSLSSTDLLNFAQSQQVGGKYPIYASHTATLAVLRAVQRMRPAWWSDECETFVASVAASTCGESLAHAPAEARHAVFIVEGLDGVGKTTVTTNLAEKLAGARICTPDPSLDRVRKHFQQLEELLMRAFYCGANYLAADQIAAAAATGPVVVDRWYASTCGMALVNAVAAGALPALPDQGDPVYRWPSDLPPFDVAVVLDVDEDIRAKRMAKRGGDPKKHEAKLAASRKMREDVLEAYCRMGCERVEAQTYMQFFNSILDIYDRRGAEAPSARLLGKLKEPATRYTADELRTITPY